METGTVENWKESQGYGFIRPDDESVDVFLHRKAFAEGVEINVGDRVEFEVAIRDRGPYAKRARMR